MYCKSNYKIAKCISFLYSWKELWQGVSIDKKRGGAITTNYITIRRKNTNLGFLILLNSHFYKCLLKDLVQILEG